MLSKNISMSSSDTLCEYVSLDQFKGILQERIAISPDTLAVLMRDGEIVHTGHGAHLSVGGIWQSLRESIGGTHALQLLIADLKPFQSAFPIVALSRDKVEVHAEATIELQVDPESGSNILGLASASVVTPKIHVFERLLPHLQERVFQAQIQKVDADTIRGDIALQDKLQSEVLLHVERLMGDLGILVRSVTLNWALNDEEAAQMQARAETREQDLLDDKLKNYSREIERTATVTRLKVTTTNETEAIKAASDNELRHMLLAQEFDFVDARETAERTARMKALESEIEEIKTETHARFELGLAEAKNEVDLRKIKAELERFDREANKLDVEQDIALKKLAKLEELEVAEVAHAQHATNLERMQDIENKGRREETELDIRVADSETERRLAEQRQADDTKLAETRLMQNMTPDQILAMNAGLSADVANVFAERAKAEVSNSEEKQALLERLIESGAKSGDDAKYYFEQFKQGVIGVSGGHDASSSDGQVAQAICPQCKKENESNARFCTHCGYQMQG